MEVEVGDFPVLLAGLGTLFIAGSSETLLAAGRRDVAVLQVVVLTTVRPATTELHIRILVLVSLFDIEI